jgi:L-malate glycosyltransferase
MKIAIVGPIHQSSISGLLSNYLLGSLPQGYYGAPFLGNLIEEYLQMGHQVIAITTSSCLEGEWETREYVNGNFTWIVVPSRPHAVKFKFGKKGRILDCFAFEKKMMINAIWHSKPDIVHAHWSYEFASAGICSKYPCLVTVHDNHWQVLRYLPRVYRLIRALMAERNLKKLKFATTVSPYMAGFLQKKVAQVSVVPNPVRVRFGENEVSELLSTRLQFMSSKPQFIMINNGWEGLKNGQFGLQVFKLLQERWSNAHLHLVGNGSEPGGAANIDALKLGLNKKITFHGRLLQRELFELMKDVHLLLHTSKEESFGVVLIEAASIGIPSVGYYQAGAVPWVIGQEDLLYKNWEPIAVANQIVQLLSNRKKYTDNSRKAYSQAKTNFSLQHVAASYLDAYNTVLKNSNGI